MTQDPMHLVKNTFLGPNLDPLKQFLCMKTYILTKSMTLPSSPSTSHLIPRHCKA